MKKMDSNNKNGGKYIPAKPQIAKAILRHIKPNADAASIIENLTPDDTAALFFEILQNKENVSHISQIMRNSGYAENNLTFPGETEKPGDELSLCRWVKAACGATIMVTREDKNGELEILFGNKNGTWLLPGGHYELDDHANLEHTMVAELIEETGIILLSDEFRHYAHAAIEQEKDNLPYDSIENAPSQFIANNFVWEMVTVISGQALGWQKRHVGVAYRIHIYDGQNLKPIANDDLTDITWFKISKLSFSTPGSDKESKKDIIHMGELLLGHNQVVETAIRRIRALEIAKHLVKDHSLEDLDFYVQHLQNLKRYSYSIERKFNLPNGSILRNCLVGPDYKEYVPRAITLHKLQQRSAKYLEIKKELVDEL